MVKSQKIESKYILKVRIKDIDKKEKFINTLTTILKWMLAEEDFGILPYSDSREFQEFAVFTPKPKGEFFGIIHAINLLSAIEILKGTTNNWRRYSITQLHGGM